MGDFVSMSNDEILRFQKMEKLLENKISRRFKIRRLDKDDFGYLIEHLYGQTGTAYEEYEYHLSKKKLDNETLITLPLTALSENWTSRPLKSSTTSNSNLHSRLIRQ